jgi:TIR domain
MWGEKKLLAQHPLFSRVSIFTVIQERQERLREALSRLSQNSLDEEKLAENITKQYELDVPMLDETKTHATTKEVQLDVSDDPQRRIRDRSKPFFVTGTEITIHLPFQGDARAFDFRPSEHYMNRPVGEFDERELRFVFSLIQPRDIKNEVSQTISNVKQNLDNLRPSAIQLRRDLLRLASSLISERKQRQVTNAQIIASLGLAAKPPESPAPIQESPRIATDVSPDLVVTKKVTKLRTIRRRWDFFICHASEDKKEIAKPLADALKAKGKRVWYDDFSLKIGDTLTQTIDDGLLGSRFGIVILSPHFFEKHWTQQELNGLVTREVDGKKVILPVWHHVGFEDVRANSPTLAGRLAVTTDKGIDHVVQKLLEAAGI